MNLLKSRHTMKLITLAALLLPSSAMALQDNIFKNIRPLVGMKQTLMSGAYTETVVAQNSNPHDIQEQGDPTLSRALQSDIDPETVRCFWECVNQNMTAEQCEAYIRSVIGKDLSYHEIKSLVIKINRPRSADALATSYFMVGIPVNIFGEVDCAINNGIISYPWEWVVSEGNSVFIPNVPCIGLNGAECCDKMMTTYADAGIPLVDINGNCLSCWVYQEPLEPIIDPSGSGATVYIEHQVTEPETCGAINLSVNQVNEADSNLQNSIQDILPVMQNYIDNGATCTELLELQRELLLLGRALPKVMTRIPRLLCGLCDGGVAGYPGSLPTLLEQDMLWIMLYIVEIWSSVENCIIIYTDHQGLVMEPPLIGGSRAELDWDRNDPNCDEPMEQDEVIDGGDGGTPPGSCTAITMASSSMSAGEDCFPCRECLLTHCDWSHSTRCHKLLKGKRTGTSEDWLACLESNGLDETYTVPENPGHEHWCACTTICKEECVLGGPPPVPTCDLDQVANESATSIESCFGCRKCIRNRCMEDEWSDACKDLMDGDAVGTGLEFLSCLESDGASTSGSSGTLEIDFSPDSCAKRCADDCEYDFKPEISPSDCLPLQMTDQAVGGTCDACRTCLQVECEDDWSVEGKKPKCVKLLTGKAVGTPVEWVSCLESDGDSTWGGTGEGWDYYAACAQNCEDSCQTQEPPPAPDMCTYSDLAEFSAGAHSPCSDCRECLSKKCSQDWGIAARCTQLIDGDVRGTAAEWTSCLESNGESHTGGSGAATIDFASSLDCVNACEDKCEFQEPPTFTDVDDESCMPNMMETEAQGGTCNTCRECLDTNCSAKWAGSSDTKKRCLKLLNGKAAGNYVEWVSCLQYNGESRFKADFETPNGGSLWATFDTCAHSCIDECDMEKPPEEVDDTLPPMCAASDLAELSDSNAEACFQCRKCMKNKCDQWTGECAKILNGKKASADEWAHCVENCGGGLDTSRRTALRALSHNGVEFDPDDRTTWCGCSRQCDNKCILPE